MVVLSRAKRKKLAKLLTCVWKGTKKFGLWPTVLANYQTISRENWVVWARDSMYLRACNTIMAYICNIINMAINFKWCRISASLVTRGSTNFLEKLECFLCCISQETNKLHIPKIMRMHLHKVWLMWHGIAFLMQSQSHFKEVFLSSFKRSQAPPPTILMTKATWRHFW